MKTMLEEEIAKEWMKMEDEVDILALNKLGRWFEEIWKFLNCRKPKPTIVFRKQHPTARYLKEANRIEIREDSWAKMPAAEKKLVLLHECLHACGMLHQAGFRTAVDTLSNLLYFKIWGKDKDWVEFEKELFNKIKKVRK
ncbi:MAG: hypothetical protein ACTSYD_02280 [Candidatus Heimdallarchaeaceae archaeon]